MEHHPLGGAFLPQHLDDVVVGVPVMDLEGQPETFGDVDVPAKGITLVRQPVALRSEEIQSGLADGPDPRVRRQGLDLCQGVLQFAAGGVLRRIVGVQGDGTEQPRIQFDCLNGKPGRFEVAPHLHGALHPHRRGGVQCVSDADIRARCAGSPSACGCP